MFELSKISARYAVRRLTEGDAAEILALMEGNPQYYLYSASEPSPEQIREDLTVTPPGIGPEDKYYIGFYRNGALAAVMDLIDGYPGKETAFIGFFMMDAALQGRGEGTGIIGETEAFLRAAGKTAVRLGIDKGNPQSLHFWEKNGFTADEEAAGPYLPAEKKL